MLSQLSFMFVIFFKIDIFQKDISTNNHNPSLGHSMTGQNKLIKEMITDCAEWAHHS